MNIHLIVIAYGLSDDLTTLYTSMQSQSHHIHWHLFRHSEIPEVVDACNRIGSQRNVTYYPYGLNRGVAKSSNEGLLLAYQNRADYALILADDVQPGAHDLDLLIEAAQRFPQYPIINAMAWHENWKKYSSMEQSFTVVTPLAIQRLGCYDENFFPLYCEDKDYEYRLHLAGLEMYTVQETQTIHAGHKSVRTNPILKAQNKVTYQLNREYYKKKWGGYPGEETYTSPFNNPIMGVYIDPYRRYAPYPGHNRDDQSIVKV